MAHSETLSQSQIVYENQQEFNIDVEVKQSGYLGKPLQDLKCYLLKIVRLILCSLTCWILINHPRPSTVRKGDVWKGLGDRRCDCPANLLA